MVSSGAPKLSLASQSDVRGVESANSAATNNQPFPVPAQAQAPPPASAYVPSVPPDYVPPPQQAPPSAPIYAAPPPTQVVLPAAPPQFVYVPELGYYVAVGLAYDMIYDGKAYYFFNNGYWYRTSYYGGPWIHVAPRFLPQILVKYNIRQMHRYRDLEFKRYEREKAHYRGRLHRPEVRTGERKEERH